MQTSFPNQNRYSVNFVIIGWFVGFGLTIYYMLKTFITIDAAFHLLLVLSVLAAIIYALRFKVKAKKALLEIVLYNMVSVGMLSLGLILMINFQFCGSPYGEYHALAKERHQPYASFEDLRLEDGSYRYFGYVLDLDDPEMTGLYDAEAVELQVANGLLGFKVLKGKRFIDLGNRDGK